ncbi:MAG: HEAT repeat domain-containing protein [Phycisphaerae bacterium]|jgi:HEAT repeat protein|nr:HEAT repeat domain-containing protein [Phycisphaerae bacterium]
MIAKRTITVIGTIAVLLTFTVPAAADEKSADSRTIARIKLLTAALEDSDQEVRKSALSALTKLDGKLTTEVFLKYADDADPVIRYGILQALAAAEDPRCFEVLIDALRDESSGVRATAARGLGKLCDKRATPFLIFALSDPSNSSYGSSQNVGSAAAEALLAIGAPAVEYLVRMLQMPPYAREPAMRLLATMPAEYGSLEALKTAAADKSWRIRLAAVKTLGGLKSPPTETIIRAASDKSLPVRRQAVTALARLKDAKGVRDALVKSLNDHDPKIQYAVLVAIARTKPDKQTVTLCAGLLRSPSSTVRSRVASILTSSGVAGLNDSVVVPALISAIGDKFQKVRQHAVEALANIGGDEVIKSLTKIAKGADSSLRTLAINGLVKIEDAKASIVLVELLDSKDVKLRSEVVSAMYYRRRPSSRHKLRLKPLQKALVDPDPSIRRSALDMLVVFRPKNLAEVLIQGLKDPDVQVRIAAVKATYRMPESNDDLTAALVKAVGDSELRVRTMALQQLLRRRITPEAVKPLADILIEKLKPSPNSKVKTWRGAEEASVRGLVSALGKTGDKRAIPALVAALNDKHDTTIRYAAAEALGQVGDKSVAKHLIGSLKDSSREVRITALRALWITDKVSAVKATIPMLKDRDLMVRREAIRRLGDARDKQASKPLQQFAGSKEPRIRDEAAIALAKVDSKAGCKPYIAWLKTRSSRKELVEAMEKTGKDDLVEALITVLKHESKLVVRAAIYELNTYGDARAIEPLNTYMKTTENAYVSTAKSAVDAITVRQKKP